MASPTIHLAIAKKYLDKHPSLDSKEFIKGVLFPDASENSIKLHYPKTFIMDKFAIGVYNKVDLYAFLDAYPRLDDFELGWFLHLVTDYLFFHECFTTDYLKCTTHEVFCDELYHAYDCLESYLRDKYHVTKADFKDYPNEYYEGIQYEKCLLSKELVDKFIKRVSDIDLDSYIEKIRSCQSNVEP